MTPRSGLRIGASVVGFGLTVAQFGSPAQAQITFSGVPGALTGSSITIGAASGQQFDGNLFHSFSRFNVNTGQTVTFAGPANVVNIISRVTGGSVSNIDGQLGSSIANANLYLINPSGVVFGANASLAVTGSFYATTADYLKLGTTGIFHASNPNPAASTLSSAPPSAFGFLGSSPASIRVRDSILKVPAGQTLSLVGGDISISGVRFGAVLLAAAGRINLASAAGPGEISFLPDGIAASPGQALGQIDISNAQILAGSGSTGLASGPIYIRGGNITFSDETFVGANNKANSPGGGISLAANGTVGIAGGSFQGGSDGAGKGGGISIAAAQLVLRDGALLYTATTSSGDAGDITLDVGRMEVLSGGLVFGGTLGSSSGTGGTVNVKATGAIVVSGTDGHGTPSGITALTSGSGSAGNIRLSAPLITVDDQGAIMNGSLSTGAAGAIDISVGRLQVLGGAILGSPALFGSGNSAPTTIRASESVLVRGADANGHPSSILADTLTAGRAGDITIYAPIVTVDGGRISSGTYSSGIAGAIVLEVGRFEILGGGLVQSNTSGLGAGGSVRIHAAESVLIQGTNSQGFISELNANTDGVGRAGDISISAPLFTLRGGLLDNPTFAAGNAGAITVNVGRLEILEGGLINSAALAASTGAGGLVSVRVSDSLLIQGQDADGRPSRIVTDTAGAGAAGSIVVSAGSLVLDGGLISSSSSANSSSGAAGTIRITAGSVQLAAGGGISVQSQGTGNAGSILIDAGQRLELTGGSAITTEAVSADGGDIHITAREMVHLRDSSITTSVGTGAGNGGNITIDPTFVVLSNSRIIANAFAGNGGNISIVSEFFITDSGSVVHASSQRGISGSVVIAAPQSNVGSSVTVLPSAYFDASALMRESCAARAGRANSFVQAGRGGLGAQPGDLAFGDYGWRGPARAGPTAEARPPRYVVLALGSCAEFRD